MIHGLDEIIRTRMLMIAAGYEEGNDADSLRRDPMFKLAMGRAMVDHYCHSFRQVPRRVVLDIDDTFDAVHFGQQLRPFNAHHAAERAPTRCASSCTSAPTG